MDKISKFFDKFNKDYKTISEYAGIKNISVQAVGQQIDAGTVVSVLINGEYRIDIEETNKLQNKINYKSKANKTKSNTDDWNRAVELWFAFYKSRKIHNPIFSKIERGCLDNILVQLNTIESGKSAILFEFILKNWDRLPNYIKDELTLSNMINKLPVIISKLSGKSDSFDNLEW